MAAKKKAAPKRPPRQLWARVWNGVVIDTYLSKAIAESDLAKSETVAGPYVLAERVRER
jgi:hypothetical protein